jgi:hypothetical protein
MKTPSTEMRHSRNEINWNLLFYYSSIVAALYFLISAVFYFMGYAVQFHIVENTMYTGISLVMAYLYKPIKLPDGMNRLHAQEFVSKKIARREFFRYIYFILLFAISGVIIAISLFWL